MSCEGSGTLCEMLLMVEAVNKGIICPNKQSGKEKNGTIIIFKMRPMWVGMWGLESGVFRDDIPTKFNLTLLLLTN